MRIAGVVLAALFLEIWGQDHMPVIGLESETVYFLHYMNLTLVLMVIAVISYFYTVNGNTYQNVLFEKSNSDPLTKLYNRRYVDEAFENNSITYRGGEHTFGLLLIDVDYFKKVNDLYGHKCGDHVLITLAGILKQHVRQTTIVSRWGGEEFLIVLDNSSQEELLHTAERLRAVVESTVMHAEKTIRITITLGGAVSREEETFPMTLSRADKALYQGKQNGQNQVAIA